MIKKPKRPTKINNQDNKQPQNIEQLIRRYDLDNTKIYDFLDELAVTLNETQTIISATEPTGDNRGQVWIQKSKNIFDTKNTLEQTLYGVKVTRNSDGTITLNGTATTGFLIVLVQGLNKKISGNYTFSYKVVSGSMVGNTVRLSVNDKTSKDTINETARLFSVVWSTGETRGEVSNTLDKEMYYLTAWINSGCVFNNCKISLQIEPGSTAKEHEAYIEPRIYVKNYNGVYEKIYGEDTSIDYKSNLVKDDTYVSNVATNWCEIKEGIAYVSTNITLLAKEISTAGYTLLTGLPLPKANAEIQAHLFNSTENQSIRVRVTETGQLRWWYNPAITIKSNNALSVNISYPVK